MIAASAASAIDPVTGPDLTQLSNIVASNAKTIKGRVLIVDAKGFALTDSAAPGRNGADYSTRPEIAAAIRGHSVQVERFSKKLNLDVLATAVPIVSIGKTSGAVRITQATGDIAASEERMVLMLVLVGLLVLVIGGVAAWMIAGRITGPLTSLAATANRVRGDDLSVRAEVAGPREVRNVAVAVNGMLDRLGAFIETRQDFLRKASHQMKTPIGGMRQRLEEIEYLSPGNEEVLYEVGKADELVDRMKSITDGVLHLAKLKSDDVPHPEWIDLNRYVEELATRWSVHHEGDQGEQETNRPVIGVPAARAVGSKIACARESLDVIMDALIENGVAYGAGNGPVEVRVIEHGLEVLDRGPGLDEGEEERIFEVFGRGSAGGVRPEGTGLGLAIARETAIQSGGSVDLGNRTDGVGGARAVVLMPAEMPPQANEKDAPRRGGTTLI